MTAKRAPEPLIEIKGGPFYVTNPCSFAMFADGSYEAAERGGRVKVKANVGRDSLAMLIRDLRNYQRLLGKVRVLGGKAR